VLEQMLPDKQTTGISHSVVTVCFYIYILKLTLETLLGSC